MRWISILGSWCVAIGIGSAQEAPVMAAADAERAAVQLRGELELVRVKLGLRPVEEGNLKIGRSSLRAAHMQALQVFDQSARLFTEQTRLTLPSRPKPAAVPRAVDVAVLVNGALHTVREVKRHLGIEEPPPPLRRTDPGEAAGISGELAQCNRLLHRLLNSGPDPGELHQRVSQAMAYAMRICLSSPGQRISKEPAAVPDHDESDLSAVMIECLQLQNELSTRLDLNEVEVRVDSRKRATLGDADDLSALLLSGMQLIYEQVETRGTVPKAVYREDCEASQLVQRCVLLRRYLDRILPLLEDPSSGSN